MLVKAYAKVNISLDVTGKRDDGFHEMKMIMQRIPLCDDIEITSSDGTGIIRVITDREYIPQDEKNIAGKAVRQFLNAAGIRDKNISVSIKKHIPVCAGLGGGSSDAAAVLEGMNEMFPGVLTEAQLYAIAETLGSDVPFCLKGGTAFATGRGEILKSLPDFPGSWFLICKPEFSVSTPELFNKLDKCKLVFRPDTEGIADAICKGALKDAAQRCYNIFEDVLLKRHKNIVDNVKNIMFTNGAIGAAMSGTGSACFGIFDNLDAAEKSFAILKDRYEETFLLNVN